MPFYLRLAKDQKCDHRGPVFPPLLIPLSFDPLIRAAHTPPLFNIIPTGFYAHPTSIRRITKIYRSCACFKSQEKLSNHIYVQTHVNISRVLSWLEINKGIHIMVIKKMWSYRRHVQWMVRSSTLDQIHCKLPWTCVVLVWSNPPDSKTLTENPEFSALSLTHCKQLYQKLKARIAQTVQLCHRRSVLSPRWVFQLPWNDVKKCTTFLEKSVGISARSPTIQSRAQLVIITCFDSDNNFHWLNVGQNVSHKYKTGSWITYRIAGCE